ncbi:MAG: hypothetical protein A2096_15165 [Spirochaetes bacterium GWF1_41_5]|nr:MAG: hypothetical protein A2096_15165 [Spirochaetes bacterium GWF1_41_5]
MLNELFAGILGRIAPFIKDSTSVLVIVLLSFVIVLLFLFLIFLLSRHRYITDSNDFFRRKIKEMIKSGLITGRDLVQVPVIHGKKTIIPLNKSELLHFFTFCHYYYFKLNERIKNINIDLLFSEKRSINDFENIGRGRIFFTSTCILFENIRSRNQIMHGDITEIKVKFDYLILLDHAGCHVFTVENSMIIADFLYNVFLKEV